jgi:hypothetical protein
MELHPQQLFLIADPYRMQSSQKKFRQQLQRNVPGVQSLHHLPSQQSHQSNELHIPVVVSVLQASQIDLPHPKLYFLSEFLGSYFPLPEQISTAPPSSLHLSHQAPPQTSQRCISLHSSQVHFKHPLLVSLPLH